MTERALATEQPDYARQVRQTLQALDTIEDSSLVDLSHLALGDVQALKQEVAEIFPASNLPAFLLHGLIQLEGRTLKQDRVSADLRVLFRGSKQIGLYGTFLAAPALVLYGYQRLLALAGKDIEHAFPDGPWQFYTQFGLREDAARHCVETTGFGRAAPGASELDAATCWVYAAMRTLFAYDALLANEWEERILPRALDKALETRAADLLGKDLPRKAAERERAIAVYVTDQRQQYGVDRLASDWAALRPYAGPPGAPLGDYAAYRRARFHEYWAEATRNLPPDLRAALDARYAERRARELPAYEQQLTMLMTLRADVYEERRAALPTHMLRVALLAGGRYHLLDACARDEQGRVLVFPVDGAPDSPGVPLALDRADDGGLRDRYGRPVDVDRRGHVRAGGDLIGLLRPPPIGVVKGQVAAALQGNGVAPADTDILLAQAPRERQGALRGLLSDNTQAEIAALRFAPIIVNWDQRESAQPLADIRRTRRGCGDHALTLIRTDRSVVFDMSHVFFDALWGMALAEIMTGFASALYPLAATARPESTAAPRALALASDTRFRDAARRAAASAPVEVAAQTDAVDMPAMVRLRHRLVKVELEPTVNDLLLLARFAHAASYRPGAAAERALEEIAGLRGGAQIAKEFRRHVDEQRGIIPALLIPMDATANDPRLRLFPTTFRNPLPELLPRLDRCDALLNRLRKQGDESARPEFLRERQRLYQDLRAYGALLRALKQVTMRGDSFTTAALRLLGHLPGSVQSLVDLIPQKIGILNEIIKGHEVFSNVGHVAATSSISRFSSSRDDGETKLLVWGAVTDAAGRLSITLRDFRPHVGPLLRLGRADLARALAQDYLDAYAVSIDTTVRRIQRVLAQR